MYCSFEEDILNAKHFQLLHHSIGNGGFLHEEGRLVYDYHMLEL